MNTAVTTTVCGDPAAILDRHALRRATGVPTVSVLVGPIGAGGRIWRCREASTGRSVIVANRNEFPLTEWIGGIAERVDLRAAAGRYLARRAERDPDQFLDAWQAKTPADRDRFWSSLVPDDDDDLLRAVAAVAVREGSTTAAAVSELGERVVPMLTRLAPPADWPGVLFIAGSLADLSSAGREAVKWATRVPALSTALAVPAGIWDQFVTTALESRAKALLKEGELVVPVIDAGTIERTLTDAGATGSGIAAVADVGADAALLDSAAAVVQATAAPPTSQAEDDHARSAAERFLFAFLESLPETAGRFELNASLDFGFGPRAAEVDLLCRSPQIAIELDGYFHFLAPNGYRRDRTKDWELQRRGFIVLRFLAEDVIPQLEVIRDRILAALTLNPHGADR